jgi:hypothetical protein
LSWDYFFPALDDIELFLLFEASNDKSINYKIQKKIAVYRWNPFYSSLKSA